MKTALLLCILNLSSLAFSAEKGIEWRTTENTIIGTMDKSGNAVFNGSATAKALCMSGDCRTVWPSGGTNELCISGDCIGTVVMASSQIYPTGGGPAYLTQDETGGIWVGNDFDSTITIISSTGVITTLAGLGGNVTGIASDHAGNMWVVESDNSVSKISVVDYSFTVYTGLPSTPYGIVYDGDGFMWIPERGGQVTKVDVTNGNFTTYTAGILDFPISIVSDNQGYVWVPAVYQASVQKISVVDGSVTATYGGTGSYPEYITFNGSNLIGVANTNESSITLISTATGDMNTYSGFSGNPISLAYDNNKFWWLGTNANIVYKWSSDTGFIDTEYSGIGLVRSIFFDGTTAMWMAFYLHAQTLKVNLVPTTTLVVPFNIIFSSTVATSTLAVNTAAYFNVWTSTQEAGAVGDLVIAYCPPNTYELGGGCKCTGAVAQTDFTNWAYPDPIAGGTGTMSTGWQCQQLGATNGACAAWVKCSNIKN